MRTVRVELLLCAVLAAILAGCGSKGDKAPQSGAPKPPSGGDGKQSGQTTAPPPVTGLKDLKMQDVKQGKGRPAARGDLLIVAYTGKLKNGTQFDTNEGPTGTPFPLVLGESPVIEGWTKGLVGMRKGGVRKLSIPSAMAYGDQGNGQIPPRSDLFFEVRLLDLVKKGEEAIYDKTDLRPGKGRAAKKGDTITVNYSGWLANGKKFDSSYDRKEPYTFKLGAGDVIPGWDYGLVGMKVGGTRQLRLPPAVAYRDSGELANQVLNFKVELLAIK